MLTFTMPRKVGAIVVPDLELGLVVRKGLGREVGEIQATPALPSFSPLRWNHTLA